MLINYVLLNMKKYKTLNLSALKLQRTKKGFTLIELLLVIAIIAIMSTMILMMLDSGREKAELNRYKSYAVQMHRLVADSVAAGQFDSVKADLKTDDDMCLGNIGYACKGADTTADGKIYKALTYLTEMPTTTPDNAFSPYDKTQGVYMVYRPAGETNKWIRVYMYLLDTNATGNSAYLDKVCDSMGWATDNNGYCSIDVPLHSRL